MIRKELGNNERKLQALREESIQWSGWSFCRWNDACRMFRGSRVSNPDTQSSREVVKELVEQEGEE